LYKNSGLHHFHANMKLGSSIDERRATWKKRAFSVITIMNLFLK
uniref:Uncharacterized protein n=1 Tax=Aegilops tauschii subsp. strangulata TaxID=200361 RepID=A0A453HHR3_AEGTS